MEDKVKDLILQEKNKLPLTFEYMEFFGNKRSDNPDSTSSDYLKCSTYQTDYLLRKKPFKPLTRLL
ncbi:hypothetical protein ACFU8T_13995 [Sphingobacterium spiritivorum]|uniref:hypothetical protein n=1 Tax=Sphingobacterium spiritivorum TaxID=258 RepID=UPI0002FDEC55|nr:hypothetical protein [Sphingobacterium spiritivorum]QQT36522.1 hypothetical protein I6J01_03585 [Sphingobacterium spiritivorum]WQD33273.1 hypothetical protein U0038_17295 [Sphingobacterium spiritivorum]